MERAWRVQLLGNRLYPHVASLVSADEAAKVTPPPQASRLLHAPGECAFGRVEIAFYVTLALNCFLNCLFI